MTLALVGGVLAVLGSFQPERWNGLTVTGLVFVVVGVFFHVLIVEPAQRMVEDINRDLDRG